MKTHKLELLERCHQNGADGLAFLELGLAHTEAGEHEAAVLAYERAVQLGASQSYLPLAYAYQRAGATARDEVLMRELIDLNCCTTNGWLEMEYGRLLLRLGKDEEVFAVFGPMGLSENPQTAIPARAVLLEGHTRVNAFERGRAVEDLESVWSHMFVSSACNRLKELGTASGEPFARAPHPYPDTDIGCSMDCLAVYGRFGHRPSEYLGVRLLCEKYRVPLETPGWVGHYVFELSDPLPAVRRKQVKKNITQIRQDADATGGHSLCGRDFFAPGGQVEWNHATVERTRRIFKIRDFLKSCLDRFLEWIKQRGRHVVCFHIRLGDRAVPLQENHCAALYLHWLRANWKLLNNGVLYIASDNAEVACAWFEEFAPVQVKSFECELSVLEWRGFYVLMMAQVVAISQSGFSIMASVLNAQEGAIFCSRQQGRVPESVSSGLHEPRPLFSGEYGASVTKLTQAV